MSERLLYIMCPPDGGPDVKVGITTLEGANVRFGTYQCALGPRILCKWMVCWVGPPREIEFLEREVKKRYRDQILYEGPGLTEWVCDLTWEAVAAVVESLIAGHRFKVQRLPQEFLPLTAQNLPQYRVHRTAELSGDN